QLTARVEVEDRPCPSTAFRGMLDTNFTLRIDISVQDLCFLESFQVHPDDALTEPGLKHALLDQDLPLQNENPTTVFRPGRNRVRAEDDRSGVARQVARRADDFVGCWLHRACLKTGPGVDPGRSNQDGEGDREPSCPGLLHQGASMRSTQTAPRAQSGSGTTSCRSTVGTS